jgi:hypothetical protein
MAQRAQAAEVRAQALEVAAGWSPPDAPGSWGLTAALFRLVADHDGLLQRLAALPADRLPALLGSAAICSLVRRERPEPLARYFPEPGRRQPALDQDFGPAGRRFIDSRLDEIMAICAGHRYQMNEVARCAQVAAGIAATSAGPGPIALVDLGTGAGLGLQLDRYQYQIGGLRSGPPQAGLRLSCALRGDRQPPLAAIPPIAERAGIDANPVDLADPAALAWLQACCPPEAGALTRLTAAAAVARRNPAPIVTGDVVDELPGVLDGLPAGLPVTVVDAYLAVFLPASRRRRLAAIMADAARARRVTWLSLDPLVPLGPAGRDSVQDLDVPAGIVRDYARGGVFAVLGARTFGGSAAGDGRDQGRLLARAHPSGRWMEWLA